MSWPRGPLAVNIAVKHLFAAAAFHTRIWDATVRALHRLQTWRWYGADEERYGAENGTDSSSIAQRHSNGIALLAYDFTLFKQVVELAVNCR